MNSIVTPMPTRRDTAAEAARETAAITQAQNSAAVAQAEAFRYARCSLYNVIAGNRHGVVLEELVEAFSRDHTLVTTLLAAMQSDGEIVEHGGLYRVSLPGAA